MGTGIETHELSVDTGRGTVTVESSTTIPTDSGSPTSLTDAVNTINGLFLGFNDGGVVRVADIAPDGAPSTSGLPPACTSPGLGFGFGFDDIGSLNMDSHGSEVVVIRENITQDCLDVCVDETVGFGGINAAAPSQICPDQGTGEEGQQRGSFPNYRDLGGVRPDTAFVGVYDLAIYVQERNIASFGGDDDLIRIGVMDGVVVSRDVVDKISQQFINITLIESDIIFDDSFGDCFAYFNFGRSDLTAICPGLSSEPIKIDDVTIPPPPGVITVDMLVDGSGNINFLYSGGIGHAVLDPATLEVTHISPNPFPATGPVAGALLPDGTILAVFAGGSLDAAFFGLPQQEPVVETGGGGGDGNCSLAALARTSVLSSLIPLLLLAFGIGLRAVVRRRRA